MSIAGLSLRAWDGHNRRRGADEDYSGRERRAKHRQSKGQTMADEQPTRSDWLRLEGKVDQLTDAITKLVLIEERQITQGQRVGALEQRMAAAEAAANVQSKVAETSTGAVERKLDMWINRGVGVWFFAGVLVAAYQLWHKSP